MPAQPDESVLERVALLESHMMIQEEIITAMQAERIEAERLNDSVVRLGDGATSLSEALLQVDKNQQTLTRLGRQLEQVENKAVTKEELAAEKERKDEEDRQFRKSALRRTYTIGLSLLLALLVGAAIFDQVLDGRRETQIKVCEQRNGQTLLIIETLRDDFGQSAAAERFERSLIDCRAEFTK